MNKERYNQIIDEVYENYSKEYEKDNSIGMTFLIIKVDGKSVYHKPDKERFVAMCTYDKTFSEKWELKIDERKLNDDERVKLYENKTNTDTSFFPTLRETLTFHNIPTKRLS